MPSSSSKTNVKKAVLQLIASSIQQSILLDTTPSPWFCFSVEMHFIHVALKGVMPAVLARS
eukprot:4456887-Amphidinium_carterae.3